MITHVCPSLWGKTFKSLTFPGSSLERGTLRKHLFNDRLCRIEFCGGNRGKGLSGVEAPIKNQTRKSNSQVSIIHSVERFGWLQWYDNCPPSVSRFYPRSYRSSICVRSHQEAISLISIQQTTFWLHKIYLITWVPKIGARRNPTLGMVADTRPWY